MFYNVHMCRGALALLFPHGTAPSSFFFDTKRSGLFIIIFCLCQCVQTVAEKDKPLDRSLTQRARKMCVRLFNKCAL
jgi:hypothetical protein